MKRRVLSIALALLLCMSAMPDVHAWWESLPPQAHVLTAEFAVPYAEVNIPTPQEVYEAMIALQEDPEYLEGTTWTDATHSYRWHGGVLEGNVSSGTGCVAFAFILSDTAFGELPATMYSTFKFSDVKVGDILRVEGGSHTVIVLQVTDTGVVIAEGNFNGKVHWGRTLTKAEVEAAVSLITRYPEGYIPPDDPTANEPIDGGTGTIGNLIWTLTKAGTLTISGNGAMPDFTPEQLPGWTVHKDKILKIVIKDGVTSVGSSAFQGSSALSAEIPSSVKTIGNNAFRGCSRLISATVSEGVETIGENVFLGCTQLKSITLPASIVSLGAGTFTDCIELMQAVFASGSNTVQIGDDLFARCRNLTKVTLPVQIDRISDRMFLNCLMLPTVSIPQGAESIGEQAFASCSSLASVTIPDSVTQIGPAAFSACGVTDIYFGGSEEQWSAVRKLGDTQNTLATKNIHYNSPIPGPDPGPDPDPDPGPGHTHTWNSGIVTKPASCTDSGIQTYTCTGCNSTRTETIPSLGHNYEASPAAKPATCTEDGEQISVCSRCDDVLTEAVPAKGHALVRNANGDYECRNELDASGQSVMVVTTPVGEGYLAVRTKDGYTAPSSYAYQNAASAQQYASEIVHAALESVSSLLSYTITTIRFTPPTQTVDGEYIYQVTIRSNGRSAASILTTEPLRMVIPAGSIPEPTPVPDPVPPPDFLPGLYPVDTYSVALLETTGGKVTSNIRYAAQGDRVIISVHPDAGYELAELTVTDIQGRNVSIQDLGDNRFSFTMPGVKVEISAVFTSSAPDSPDSTGASPDDGDLGTPGNINAILNPLPVPFTDVPPSEWYCSSVEYVWQHYLMNGVSNTQFAPHQTTSRAMIWTILARMNNISTDITPGSIWYEKGMLWAMEQGVTDGSNPMEDITREQLAVMLWRNAGCTSGGSSSLDSFSDAADVSSYAVNAVEWAVSCGILQGSGGSLNPKGTATRAEVAAMVMRYASNT